MLRQDGRRNAAFLEELLGEIAEHHEREVRDIEPPAEGQAVTFQAFRFAAEK